MVYPIAECLLFMELLCGSETMRHDIHRKRSFKNADYLPKHFSFFFREIEFVSVIRAVNPDWTTGLTRNELRPSRVQIPWSHWMRHVGYLLGDEASIRRG